MLLLVVTLLLCGAVLLLFGMRSRCIDDHPICRRCGFDLYGRPETSKRCSECGAELNLPQSIRIGHRKRRPILLMSGLAVSLLGLGWLGLITASSLGGANLNPYKPVFWLAPPNEEAVI